MESNQKKSKSMHSLKMIQIIHRSLLKTILQFIMSEPQNCTNLIKKITEISKANIKISDSEELLNSNNEILCMKCSQAFKNKFIYILHLEVIHVKDIVIEKYQVKDGNIIIHQGKSHKERENFIKWDGKQYHLENTSDYRIKKVLGDILKKFMSERSNKPTYYHSADIFRTIGEQSQDQDSEAEATYIERDLQQRRLDYTDVNYDDTMLYRQWNQLIHQKLKKGKHIMNLTQMGQYLIEFAQICKLKNISRMSLFSHAFTLWSVGKIEAKETLNCLKIYDNTTSMTAERTNG